MSSVRNDALISAVHVASTGSAAQHKEHRNGSRLPSLVWALTSQSWIKVPINVYVFVHRDGLVLFDTGLDAAIGTNPGYVSNPIVRFFLHRLFRLRIGPGETLGAGLKALGYAARDIRKAIISHLHFDHVGGIGEIPNAELLVSADEWRTLSAPHPERKFVFCEHIELPGARWRQIEFSPTDDPLFAPFGGRHDVMGDGSMVLLPTPGHTPGSVSMLVRANNWPPLLFVGDLTYEEALLMNDQPPGTGDPAQLRSSFAKVRGLKARLPEMMILPTHDNSAADTLATLTLP